MHLLLCAHLIIFYYIYRILELSLYYVCTTFWVLTTPTVFNPFYSNLDILKVCTSYFCAYFLIFFWMLSLDIIYAHKHRFTSATLMGCLLYIICNTFHSFYTNLAYIQVSSNSMACVCGGGVNSFT